MKIIRRKNVNVVIAFLLLISILSVTSYARDYNGSFNNLYLKNQAIEPYFTTIQNIALDLSPNNLRVILETQDVETHNLRINLNLFEEKSGKYVMIMNKTFSHKGYSLDETVSYNFKEGVNYKIIVKFYADNEYDVIERYYMI